MVCLGFEPATTVWQVQTIPRSYGGRKIFHFFRSLQNMGQSRPLFCFFVLFTSQINYKLKKCRWSAWDSNPGPQDGRRRQNYRAMVATQIFHFQMGNVNYSTCLFSLKHTRINLAQQTKLSPNQSCLNGGSTINQIVH